MTLPIRPELLADLRTFEGQAKPGHPPALIAYPDTVQRWTIGFGHAVGVHPGDTINASQAESLLQSDAAAAQQHLVDHFPWYAAQPPARQDGLINLCFNLGITTLLTFNTFLALCAHGSWAAAALDLKGTKWYRQVNGDGRGDLVCGLIERGVR